jgi:hypothetical protein
MLTLAGLGRLTLAQPAGSGANGSGCFAIGSTTAGVPTCAEEDFCPASTTWEAGLAGGVVVEQANNANANHRQEK